MAGTLTGTKKRSLTKDYLQITDPETSTQTWILMGTGFTQVDKSPNSTTTTVRFVDEDSDSTITTGYQVEYAINILEMTDNLLIEEMLDVSRKRLIGEGTLFNHRRVYYGSLHRDPTTGVTTPGVYKAYEQVVNIATNDESPSDNLLAASITMSFVSDFQYGSYTQSTDTFTAD